MDSNKSPQDFYKTHLNILRGPLELIDVQKLADACADKWYNQTLCKVNDSVVRWRCLKANITGMNTKTSMRTSSCPKACAIAHVRLNEP